MPGLSPEALQEIRYSVYDEVHNPKNPYIYDRVNMPTLSMLMKRARKRSGVGEIIQAKIQRNGGLRRQHFSGRQILEHRQSRVDFELEFEYNRTFVGLELEHEELEREGYRIIPHGPRGRSFAKSLTEASAIKIMNIFEQKIEDLDNQFDEEMNEVLILDGSQDTQAPQGMEAYMTLDPAAGDLGGKPRTDKALQHQVLTGTTTTSGGTMEKHLRQLIRAANLNNRGFRSNIDFIRAGADWIDGYIDFAKANNLNYEHPPTEIKRLDVGIPDSALHFQNIPIIHDPTMEILDSKFPIGYSRTKSAMGVATKTWELAHAPGKLKEFSAPLDPPDQRFTWMGIESRVALIPTKISGNFLNVLA